MVSDPTNNISALGSGDGACYDSDYALDGSNALAFGKLALVQLTGCYC